MSGRLRVGYVGVGLMGHGAAKNILLKGWPLTVAGNRNRVPVDDLVAQGATEAATAADVAAQSDVVFLCLPSSVEVEHTVLGPGGLAEAMRPGMVLVDSTSADPTSTRRIGALLEAKGCAMVDAPVGRTPKEAEAGMLSTFLGGAASDIARVRPIIEAYADTIIEAGALGAGHTLKLVNNFISIGTCAVIGEAVATASKLGVDLQTLFNVVSSGGANSAMFQMMAPWFLEGDDSRLRGPLRIAGKDLRFFCKLADSVGMPVPVAAAATQSLALVNAAGHRERFMPALPGVLASMAGAPFRDI